MGQKAYFRGELLVSGRIFFLEMKSHRDTIHFLILFIETIPVVGSFGNLPFGKLTQPWRISMFPDMRMVDFPWQF